LLFDLKDFKLPITFRQLNEEFDSSSLSNYLDENLAQDEFNDVSNGMVAPTLPQQNQVAFASSSQSDLSLNLITQQLAILGQQIELLKETRQLRLQTKQ
jgi:hypothetical protein